MIEVIRLHTLFDITDSGIHRNYNPKLMNFKDNQGNILSNSKLWEFSRNQQRNLDVIKQLLCLRQEVSKFYTPLFAPGQERIQHKFGKRFEYLDVWTMDFSYEHIDHGFMLRAIYDDFDHVPLITGLKEMVNINPACINVSGANRNVYFTKEVIKVK